MVDSLSTNTACVFEIHWFPVCRQTKMLLYDLTQPVWWRVSSKVTFGFHSPFCGTVGLCLVKHNKSVVININHRLIDYV